MRIGRKRLLRALERGLSGQVVRRELGREVVCLTGEDHGAVASPEDQRLMPLSVAGRRNDPDSRPELGLTGEFLVNRSGEVDELIDGVVAAAGGGQLHILDQDGLAYQERVSSAVVEVKVAVHDDADVCRSDSGCRQRGLQRAPLGAVVRFGPGVRVADTGVEEKQSLVVPHQVGERGLDPRLRAARLRSRPDEVPQIEPTHRHLHPHTTILAARDVPSRCSADTPPRAESPLQ